MSGTLVLAIAATVVISYLLGSINSAIIVSYLHAKDDVRRHGSGNAGMTNILRTYGKGPAVMTALGDFLKAVISIVISRWIFSFFGITLVDAGYIAGFSVLLGHLFPIYFKFKGGKGVMTTLGVIVATDPIVFLIVLLICLPIIFISRMVSLGSIIGAIVFPVLTGISSRLQGRNPVYNAVCAAIISLIIIFMHRENIKRIINGTENKFEPSKKK